MIIQFFETNDIFYYSESKNNKNIKVIINIGIILFLIISYLLNHIFKIKIITYFFESQKDKKEIEKYFKLCNRKKLINKKKFKLINNPKISIISPIYNREKYILRFIRSIQNQFFDDIEIIFVDDFSKDNSVKLIEKFEKEDERILLIKHNKNKGTLISRNIGVLKSKGEFIILPDPDDLLSKNILNNCYELSKKYNFEMIRFNIYLGNGNIFFNNIVNNLRVGPIYEPDISTYLFYGTGILKQVDFNVANKFIKRDAYIRALESMSDFYFNLYMTNHEDGLINFILYRTAKSFYFFKKIGYYYIPNDSSITLNYQNNIDETIRFIFIYLLFIFEETKNNKYEKDMANCLFQRLYLGVLSESLNLITKDFQFFINIINLYLNCEFINKENIFKLVELKSIIKKAQLNFSKKKK